MKSLAACLILVNALAGAVATYDHTRVHYRSYGKGRKAIVFIHGWSCDLSFWSAQRPLHRKHRLLLIDLPGHGRSEKARVAYTVDRFARAVEAVMRHAGVGESVLVGHSMGGPVAITFLSLFPDKVRAIVLVDTYVPHESDAADGVNERTRRDELIRLFGSEDYKQQAPKVLNTMFSERTSRRQRRTILSRMLSTPQHVMVSAMQGLFAYTLPKPDARYSVPVLALMAAKPDRSQIEAHLRTAFSDVTYEEWSDAGHFLMMDDPERFNRIVEDFVAGTETGKSSRNLIKISRKAHYVLHGTW